MANITQIVGCLFACLQIPFVLRREHNTKSNGIRFSWFLDALF